jgi:hypothetical protein
MSLQPYPDPIRRVGSNTQRFRPRGDRPRGGFMRQRQVFLQASYELRLKHLLWQPGWSSQEIRRDALFLRVDQDKDLAYVFAT